MKQSYFTNVSCVEPNFIRVEIIDRDENIKVCAQVAVDNPQVREDAAGIVHFPLEELEYGLYGEPTEKMLVGIINNCIEQTTVLTPEQIQRRQKRAEEWRKKNVK